MHINGSIRIGVPIINIEKESEYEFEFKINPMNKEPRKVLPTSPIKIFEGSQFQIRKAKRDPTIINISNS